MTTRTSDKNVDTLFLERWSPRAFDGSDMPLEDLMTMIEAARWAPSAFNYQPWRFLYSMRGDANWDTFLSMLIPFNASWASSASALVFVVSDTQIEGKDGPKPSHSHSFDAGAAWGLLSLQAIKLGYFTHGMTGLQFGKEAELLGVKPPFRLEAGIAIGRRGDPGILPEGLRDREGPSDRKPLEEIVTAGPLTE